MIRTSIGIVLLIIATIWLPVWVQLLGYLVFCIITANPAALFLVAVFADRLYSPVSSLTIHNHYYLLYALSIYVIFQLAMRFTRLKHIYEMEK